MAENSWYEEITSLSPYVYIAVHSYRYHSYFIPVYFFIARQSRGRMSGLTNCQIRLRMYQISIGYISVIFERIYLQFSA